MRIEHSLNHVILEATRRCNLKCRYCYNYWHIKEPPALLNEGYSQAIKTLKKLFSITDVRHITFSGGEPFLADRFPELVLFCRMRKKSVNIISNGNAGTAENYESLIDMGVGLFQFPLHSAESATHDSMTGVRGSWEESVKSIKHVKAKGGRVVAVIVLTKQNCGNIASTLSHIQSLGVREVMLARFNLGGNGIINKEQLVTSKDELNAAFHEANEFVRKNKTAISANVCVPFCLVNPKDHPLIKILSCSPDFSRKPYALDTAGNLRICNHSPVIMGNIFTQSLDEIFDSEYVLKWSRSRPEYCSRCDRWNQCQGGCRAASEQMGLGLDSADPIIQYAR